MKRWPAPRNFVYGALLLGGIGILLLYGGLLALASLFLLGFVLLCILAVIATTAVHVEQAQQRLTAFEQPAEAYE